MPIERRVSRLVTWFWELDYKAFGQLAEIQELLGQSVSDLVSLLLKAPFGTPLFFSLRKHLLGHLSLFLSNNTFWDTSRALSLSPKAPGVHLRLPYVSVQRLGLSVSTLRRYSTSTSSHHLASKYLHAFMQISNRNSISINISCYLYSYILTHYLIIIFFFRVK